MLFASKFAGCRLPQHQQWLHEPEHTVMTVNSPFSVKLIHALQRLNELQDLVPLAIKHQLPETETAHFNSQKTHEIMTLCLQGSHTFLNVKFHYFSMIFQIKVNYSHKTEIFFL